MDEVHLQKDSRSVISDIERFYLIKPWVHGSKRDPSGDVDHVIYVSCVTLKVYPVRRNGAVPQSINFSGILRISLEGQRAREGTFRSRLVYRKTS